VYEWNKQPFVKKLDTCGHGIEPVIPEVMPEPVQQAVAP
jgi:hypothetical protein